MNMLTFSFGALGAGTIGDTTVTLEVPFGTAGRIGPHLHGFRRCHRIAAFGHRPGLHQRPRPTPSVPRIDPPKAYTVTVTEAILPNIFTWATAASATGASRPTGPTRRASTPRRSPEVRKSYTLNFDTPGSYTATNNLAAGFQLNQLNLGSAVTLDGNSLALVANDATLPTINQNSASQVTISNDLELGSDTTFEGSGNGQVNFTGLISGAGSLTKNGSGTLTIKNVNNSFAGGTIINSGRLYLDLDLLNLAPAPSPSMAAKSFCGEPPHECLDRQRWQGHRRKRL